MSNMQGLAPSSNPIQNTNPNPYPKPITDPKSLSFDQVSKLFNLPLSDAAESLGVCASVLKKIYYENGLVRWPYRKVISGKSIEDIKEALREKQERSLEFPKAPGEKNDSLVSSAISSFSGSPMPNKNISSTMEMPRAGAFSQQQGTRNFQSGSSSHFRISNLTEETSVSYDEFKYGFPSNGLSTATYRWWGNKSPDGNQDGKLNDDNAKTVRSKQKM